MAVQSAIFNLYYYEKNFIYNSDSQYSLNDVLQQGQFSVTADMAG